MSLAKQKSNTQALRLLALDYSVAKSGLSLSSYQKVYQDIMFTPLLTANHNSASELVERTSHLFYLLLFEGGITAPAPVNKLQTIRVDIEAAVSGFIRWADKTEKRKPGKNVAQVFGPRQFLYRPSRCALLSFLYFRITNDGVRGGDWLVPQLTPEIFLLAKSKLLWLKSVKGKPTWQKILAAYLSYRINPREFSTKHFNRINFSELAGISLMNLYHSEMPFQLEGRRGRLIPASISENQFRDFLPVNLQSDNTRKPSSELNRNSAAEAEEFSVGELQPMVGSESQGDNRTNNLNFFRGTAIEQARKFLDNVIDCKNSYSSCIKTAEDLLSQNKKMNFSSDISHFYHWITKRLEKGKKKGNVSSSLFTYSQRLLYMIKEFGENEFSSLDLDDFVLFLSQYSTVNSIKAYLTVAKNFHQFLQTELKLEVKKINWSSPLLKFNESYREREVMTEDIFMKIFNYASASNRIDAVQIKIALILMRRAGLRCAEVVSLHFQDFHGESELRLFVQASKSAAGKRTLPLYLLLDAKELDLICRHLSAAKQNAQTNPKLLKNNFIYTKSGEPLFPDQIGAEISKVFDAARLPFKFTPHDLRHAFATALFSAWWINLTIGADGNADNWARTALAQFCRSEIEGKAVTIADDIRRLMGHASLEVTFERYIHSFDLAAADRIFQIEKKSADRFLERKSVTMLTILSARHSQRLLPSKADGEGKFGCLNHLPAIQASIPLEKGMSAKMFLQPRKSKIALEKVEEWLKDKLVTEAKKQSAIKKPSTSKTSFRKKSIIKKL